MRPKNDWRLTVAVFAFVSLVESMAFGHLSVFTPLYLRHLHVAPSSVPLWTGLLGSVGAILGFPLLPFWGAWAERYSRKAIIVRSSVLEAVLFGLTALAQNPWQLGLARMLSGFAMGNTGVMMVVQSDVTPPKRIGLAIAAIGSGPSLGAALGPLFGGFLVAGPGIQSLFALDAGLTAVAALALVLLIKEEDRVRSKTSAPVLALAAVKDIFRLKAVRNLFLVYFLFAIGTTSAAAFLPIWIHQIYVASAPGGFLRSQPVAVTIGLIFAAAGVTMAIATPVLGWLGDRVGPSVALKTSVWGNTVGLILQGLLRSLGGVGGARLLQGVFQGGVGANVTTLLVRVAPADRRASIMNLTLLPQQLSWMLGPLLGTGLVSLFGIQGMLLVAGAITLTGAAFSMMLVPRPTISQPQARAGSA